MMADPRIDSQDSSDSDGDTGGAYSRYVLFVLLLVYVFNFIDRNILSILAEDIKADLGISDADLGFLYGTAFAVFYALFGIPLSRLADMWNRKKLISIGLCFWSVMTALSGSARGFGSLAAFRFGVGVGESSASPAAFSMLCDYFSPRVRATVLAIYSSGIYIGGGLALYLGGTIVDTWNGWYALGDAPLGMAGWQAAFVGVGLPGILMAGWVATLREPVRGKSEGLVQAVHPRPFSEFGLELASIVPPFSLMALYKSPAGMRGLQLNLIILTAIVLGASVLIVWLDTPAQWIGLGFGVYVFLTWVQNLAFRDPVSFKMIYRSRALVFGMIGFGWHAFVAYGIAFFQAPFMIRMHGVSATEVGLYVGLPAAVAGIIGVTGGGVLSDWLRRRSPRARPLIGLGVAIISVVPAIFMITTKSILLVYVSSFFFTMFSSAWVGSCVAMANELVLPRMRAASSAFYIVCVTFIGLALGPYTIGRTSDWLSATMPTAEALQTAILLVLPVEILAAIFLWLSARHVEAEEAQRLDRARAAGESV
jgi:MFS family permease